MLHPRQPSWPPRRPAPARHRDRGGGYQHTRQMKGDSEMEEHMPGDPGADGRFVRLDDGDMHVVEDGEPGAPAVLLIHGLAASTAWWDPVIPTLAGARPLIRADPARHRRATTPAGGEPQPP